MYQQIVAQLLTSRTLGPKRALKPMKQWRRWLQLLFMLQAMLGALATTLHADEPSNVPVAQSSESRYAIVIGIDRYTDNTLAPLQHAVDDATRFAEVLEKQGYIAIQLSNFEVSPDYLLQQIGRIGDELDRTVGRDNGTLVITYAGHGFQQDNQNYLAMGDADPSDLKGTALSMKRLKSVLAYSGIGRQVLLIDACRNDPARSVSDPDRVFVEDQFNATGLSILYSTSPGQLSYETGKLSQGVFSHFAANALAGAAQKDSQGWVTVNGMFSYVRDQVIRYNNTLGIPSQVPYIGGANNGDMRLTRPAVDFLPDLAPIPHRSDQPQILPPESIQGSDGALAPVSTRQRRPIWKVAASIAGVLLVGALLANDSSQSDDRAQEPGITVLIPTP
ncbi:MAG: caspase domain-containing protein [Granulosicoccus sp.]